MGRRRGTLEHLVPISRERAMNRIAVIALLIGTIAIGVFAAADPVSRRDAARLQAKIDKINKNSGTRGKVAARTPITETELNSYLQYELGDRIPTGVKDPWLSILGD